MPKHRPDNHGVGSGGSDLTSRFGVTPIRAGVCALIIGGIFGTLVLLSVLIPGTAENAIISQSNGDTEFVIKSAKESWIEIAFICSFFFYPALAIWIFWGPLSREDERRPWQRHISSSSRVGVLITYAVIGVLLSLAVVILAVVAIWEPIVRVQRMVIADAEVTCESLYCRWPLPRRDVESVNVIRTEERGGRGGPYAEHYAMIRLIDGDAIRTASICAQPPGSQEDQQYGQFFDALRDELTRKAHEAREVKPPPVP